MASPSAGHPQEQKPGPAAGEMSTLDRYLVAGLENQATTIYMFPGSCITYRVGNKLLKVPNTNLTPPQTLAIAMEILPQYMVEESVLEDKRKVLDRTKSCNFSYSVQGVARFRVHLFRQRGSLALCIRVIPHSIPNLSTYQLPDDFFQLLKGLRGGIFVVHGLARSGKSSLLAAIVDHLNSSQSRLIAVLEPTIQFSHRNNYSLVSQREVGSDMLSLHDGIAEALHQDQDVIILDELIDEESFEKVMEAVFKGITVFTAIGTHDVEKTIQHLLNFKPTNRQLELINDLMTYLRALITTEMNTDPAGKRFVSTTYHPGNLLNSILLSKRTELEQKSSSQRSSFEREDSTSSVDHSWFENE